jgi:hypothetical protein
MVPVLLLSALAGGCGTAVEPPVSPSNPLSAPPPATATTVPSASPSGVVDRDAAPSGAASQSPSTSPRGGAAKPVTAAARYGWSKVVARDDFTGTRLHSSWGAYDSAGNSGEGRRSPDQIKLRDGVLTMSGTADGVTAGMEWDHARKYGRWEIRARVPTGCTCYHPVLILWPEDDPWPEGGEVDYAEVFDARRATVHFFLHYGADNRQIGDSTAVDATRWHAYAVERTPDHITGYVDGEPFFRSTRRSAFPPGRMEQTIQLDWFPDGSGGTASLQVDWAAIYAL